MYFAIERRSLASRVCGCSSGLKSPSLLVLPSLPISRTKGISQGAGFGSLGDPGMTLAVRKRPSVVVTVWRWVSQPRQPQPTPANCPTSDNAAEKSVWIFSLTHLHLPPFPPRETPECPTLHRKSKSTLKVKTPPPSRGFVRLGENKLM